MAQVSEGDEPTENHTLGLFGVYTADADMNGASGCKGIKVNVTLGSEIVLMQLDTGAALSQKASTEGSCQNTLYKHQ